MVGISMYVGVVISQLLQFPLTFSITYSIILMVSNGATACGRNAYWWRRILGQVIGVGVGWGVYAGLLYLDLFSKQQTIAIGSALAAVLVMVLNHLLKLGVSDLLIVTPVILVFMMWPGNPLYPTYRVAYVCIGIGVGYLLSITLFYQDHEKALRGGIDGMSQLVDHLSGGEADGCAVLPELLQKQAQAEMYLKRLCEDRSTSKALESYQRLLRENRLFLALLETWDTKYAGLSPPLRNELRAFISHIFVFHSKRLRGEQVDFGPHSIPTLQAAGIDECAMVMALMNYLVCCTPKGLPDITCSTAA